MSGQTKSVVGVLNIVGGEWAAEPPSVLAVREPAALPSGDTPKGDLYVLVEMCSREPPVDPTHTRALAEAIRDSYYHSGAGVIASLRRALLDTHDNAPDVPAGSALAGLLAVVVRGADVFIASAGSTVVYVVSDNRAARFPERQPVGLGTDDALAPFFFHTRVARGDTLVLGDGRFAATLAPEEIAPSVAHQVAEDAVTNLSELAAGQDCTAVVVEIGSGAEPAASGVRPDPRPAHRPGPRSFEDGRQEAGDWSHAAQPGAIASISTWLHRSQIPRLLGRGLRNLGKGALAFFILLWHGLRALFINILPEHRPTANSGGVPDRLAGAEMVGVPTAPVRHREAGVRAAAAGGTHETGESGHVAAAPPARPQLVLRVLAIAIPLVVVAVAGITYWQQGVAQESNFQILMQQAQTMYQQAQGADEPAARQLLDEAEKMLAEAATIRPSDAGQLELRELVTRQQDKVNRVERLYLLGRLRNYDNPLTQLRRVVADGLDLYVLDNGADMVYYHRMDDVADSLRPDESDPVLVRRAQQVGSNVVGELVDMTWSAAAPNRQVGALLILGASEVLEQVANRPLTNLVIGGRDRWVQPVAAMGYGGNFYILDPQANQIFRYRPGEGGYPDPPESYLAPDTPQGTLNGAVDIAIDGYIYVLYADGHIRKFEGGAPAPFELLDLDRAFSNPTAVFTAPDQQVRYLYVADAGNRRIVQLEKGGRFVRQLKPSDAGTVDFAGIRSIFVDELAGKMYLVDSKALFIAAVPRIQ